MSSKYCYKKEMFLNISHKQLIDCVSNTQVIQCVIMTVIHNLPGLALNTLFKHQGANYKE